MFITFDLGCVVHLDVVDLLEAVDQHGLDCFTAGSMGDMGIDHCTDDLLTHFIGGINGDVVVTLRNVVVERNGQFFNSSFSLYEY